MSGSGMWVTGGYVRGVLTAGDASGSSNYGLLITPEWYTFIMNSITFAGTDPYNSMRK
jgi:hypothetical protein